MSGWRPAMTRNFTRAELSCRCGCGRAEMDGAFMGLLQQLRDRVGPIPINSGFRCPAHNARVSRTGADGPHTTGRAADVAVHGHRAHRLLVEAGRLGFTGIGVRQAGPTVYRFLHLDTLKDGEGGAPRPWIWSY